MGKRMKVDPAGSTVGSPTNKRNVGVLEVKMRHRLLEDQRAVAIGTIHTHHHSDFHENSSKARQHHPKKPHKLPKLSVEDRPISFDTERTHMMEELELPSPTRSLINKHVQHTKADHQKAIAHLPPVAGAFKKRGAPQSLFPLAYQRNELPIMIEPKAGGNTLRWTQDINTIDFAKYFPLFLEGMRERMYPFNFLAREGTFQLLDHGTSHPEKVVDCLHRVIPALRTNLDTRDTKCIQDALLVLQRLAQIPSVGQLLVPYYRQLLPVLSMFKSKRRNLGDEMDFQQNKVRDLGEMILETLELLERMGGPDAYVNIKYMVPTYEGVNSSS